MKLSKSRVTRIKEDKKEEIKMKQVEKFSRNYWLSDLPELKANAYETGFRKALKLVIDHIKTNLPCCEFHPFLIEQINAIADKEVK